MINGKRDFYREDVTVGSQIKGFSSKCMFPEERTAEMNIAAKASK